MTSAHLEQAETLGDTTPGAFDDLPTLEHPAVLQARADLATPPWAWWGYAAALVAAIAGSALYPWGFA